MLKPPEGSRPTERFSRRVAYYVRSRPHYPAVVLSFLEKAIGLSDATQAADVGSGTGILARLFLENGNAVYGVEPNRKMRAAAEVWLAGYERFTSVDGRAEATTLPDASVDLVTAGQAFHWFDAEAARQEFRRILRPGGHVMLLYNSRRPEEEAGVVRAYNDLWPIHGLDYEMVRQREPEWWGEALDTFFSSGYEEAQFENPHWYTFEQLQDRALSSSYVPLPGHAKYEPMVAALREVFDRYQEEGKVCFPYETRLLVGRV